MDCITLAQNIMCDYSLKAKNAYISRYGDIPKCCIMNKNVYDKIGILHILSNKDMLMLNNFLSNADSSFIWFLLNMSIKRNKYREDMINSQFYHGISHQPKYNPKKGILVDHGLGFKISELSQTEM